MIQKAANNAFQLNNNFYCNYEGTAKKMCYSE